MLIDVSHHQGVIDWGKVLDYGIEGAFIKASDGYFMGPSYTGHVDSQFQTNWTALGNNGVIKGAYAFLRLDYDGAVKRPDIEEQADIYFDTVDPQKTDVVALDAEQPFAQLAYLSKSEIRRRAIFAMDLFQERAPGKFECYTAQWWWGELFDDKWDFNWSLWSAHYWSIWQAGPLKNEPISPLARPQKVNGFDKSTFWQRSARGIIPGIRGSVDLNEFMPDMTLAEYVGIDPTAPPVPPTLPQDVVELKPGQSVTVRAV